MFFQFKKQHWIVEGPDWKHLHEALDKYAKTIAEVADKLAERINLLGGLPVSNPSRFTELAYVKFGGETKLIFEPCWKMIYMPNRLQFKL
jgi:starvation-inducible DNA-binding protein